VRYNFDEIIDRSGTDAYKIELSSFYFGTKELLPLWVADMDFRTPDFVMEAIRKRSEHEIMGYTVRNKDFFTPIINWIKYKHDWLISRSWIGFVQGIVPAMAVSVLAFTQPDDKIIIQSPVYPPFFTLVENNNRQLIINQLLLENGQYRMNFKELRKQVADPKVKMLLLCSPHNPGGRVWNKEELKELATICAENNVIVVADEIHADLVLPGYQHIPFATVSEVAMQNSITLMAPSKTFNIAGLCSSSYIIPNEQLRKIYSKQLEALEFSGGNIFAYVATKAAYEQGADWLQQLVEYIQGNIDFVVNYLQKNLPQITPIIPEASFLVWLDFSALGLSEDEVKELLVKKAKLGLNNGTSFGPGGEGFHRLNVGCSRLVLQEAMSRLKQVFGNL
jgi:cystathionine beta-lyase